MKLTAIFIALCALYWSASAQGKPAYYPYGIQNDVPTADLTGWTLCWNKTYGDTDPNLYAGAYECATASHILMACGMSNTSSQIQILAVGNASLVTSMNYGSLSGSSAVPFFVEDNNVTWYFSNATGWGYFPTGAQDAYPNQCDTSADASAQRLCWHTSDYIKGYRCGDYSEEDDTYMKYIYVPICSFDGTECDDGNACTESDTCTAGTCAGTPITCTPSSSCVSSTCVAGQCVEESICEPVQAPVQAPAAAPLGKTSSAVAMSSISAASLMLGSAVVALM